jgi:hypothetical protein
MMAMLIGCQDTLLREIADRTLRQRDIAQTYRLALESDEAQRIDWARVNAAICARWSRSGLRRIKEQAWSGRCFR